MLIKTEPTHSFFLKLLYFIVILKAMIVADEMYQADLQTQGVKREATEGVWSM